MNNFAENYLQEENEFDEEKEKINSNLFLFVGIVIGIIALVVFTKSNSSVTM